MKYLLGGLIVESKKEYNRWKAYQYHDLGIPHLVIVNATKIIIKGFTNCGSTDDIDIWKSQREYCISYAGKMLMHLDLRSDPSILSVAKEISDDAIAEIFMKRILPLIFYQKNLAIPLHATMVMKDQQTVAFVGASFAGKSTLAAYFAAYKGFHVVSDDILPIFADKESAFTYSMVTKLRLREDSAQYFDKTDIKHIELISPIKLHNIFVISEDKEIICKRLGNPLEILLKNLFASYLSDLSPSFINRVLSTAPFLSVFSLSYPKTYDLLEDVSINVLDILNN